MKEAMMIKDEALVVGIESAYRQALIGRDEGGVPIGSALIIGGAVVSEGRNQRYQKGSLILHGEMDCIEKAGHKADFSRSTLVTTLSPCTMCTGAILLFKIPRVVILDNVNVGDYQTSEDRLTSAGVEVIVAPHTEIIDLNREYQQGCATRPFWLGDVGK